MHRRLGVDGDVLVDRRAALAWLIPLKLTQRVVGAARRRSVVQALDRGADFRLRTLVFRLRRDCEAVAVDALLVDAVATGEHLLRRVDHRRRAAHVGVGLDDLPTGEELVDGLVDEAAALVLRQHGCEAEVGDPRPQLLDLGEVEEVALGARAVEEAHRALGALGGERAQQRQDRRHPRAAGNHEDRPLAAAQVERPVRSGEADGLPGLDLAAEHPGQPPALIAFDHQLDASVARDVGHRERPPHPLGARHVQVDVLAGEEGEVLGLARPSARGG